MAAEVNQDLCVGCGACAGECPCGAIEVDGTAQVNADVCAGCGACEAACPVGAISVQ